MARSDKPAFEPRPDAFAEAAGRLDAVVREVKERQRGEVERPASSHTPQSPDELWARNYKTQAFGLGPEVSGAGLSLPLAGSPAPFAENAFAQVVKSGGYGPSPARQRDVLLPGRQGVRRSWLGRLFRGA